MLDNSGQINEEEIKVDCTLTVGKIPRGTEAPLRKPKFPAPAKTHLELLLPRRQNPLEHRSSVPSLPRRVLRVFILPTLPSPETLQ